MDPMGIVAKWTQHGCFETGFRVQLALFLTVFLGTPGIAKSQQTLVDVLCLALLEKWKLNGRFSKKQLVTPTPRGHDFCGWVFFSDKKD